MDNLLSINPGLAVWTVVSFLLFFLLLRKFAWGPILQALDRREKRIHDAIESAERSRKEAEKILEVQRAELAKARGEAKAIVDEATSDAGHRSEEILAETRKESERLLERARREIHHEETQAIDHIRRDAVDIALEAATRLLGRSMTEADHRRMVEQFIADATKAAGEKNR
ncbi:MAG: F0F1 ATP synthase subunit B [Candidatus Eisenbacteria bacterium]